MVAAALALFSNPLLVVASSLVCHCAGAMVALQLLPTHLRRWLLFFAALHTWPYNRCTNMLRHAGMAPRLS